MNNADKLAAALWQIYQRPERPSHGRKMAIYRGTILTSRGGCCAST